MKKFSTTPPPRKRLPALRWSWIIVQFEKASVLGVGLPLMEYLLSTNTVTEGYFARYTNKPTRIEIKCLSYLADHRLRMAIKAGCVLYHCPLPVKISFKPFDGSHAHALATPIALALSNGHQLDNTETLRDVVHWLYNMCGFSYAQELESMLRHAHTTLHNLLQGQWIDKPYYPNPKYASADHQVTKKKK